jgi:ribosomal protein S27AE
MQAPFNLLGQNGLMNSGNTNGKNENVTKKRKYSQSQIRENESNKKATKMFLAVVAVFAVFMLPNQLIWLWADFGNGFANQGFEKAVIICWLFTYSNSVSNPAIFTVFSADFRNGFKRIFKYVYYKVSGKKMNSRKSSNTSRCTNTISMADTQNFTTSCLPCTLLEDDVFVSETVL